MKNMKQFPIVVLLLVAGGLAQTKPVNLETGTDPKPKLVNAKVQTVDASSGLRPVVDRLTKEQGPLWIAYLIPTMRKERTMCCFDNWNGVQQNGCCSGCRLENQEGSFNVGTMKGENCNLEPADFAFVFLRAQGGHITKTRVFSRDCALDAAGLNVYWLTGVKPAESVVLLAGIVRSDDIDPDKGKRVGSQAVLAIAIHNDPSVDPTLESFLAPNMPRKTRQETAFWLGQERGEKGLEILRKAIKNDSDERF